MRCDLALAMWRAGVVLVGEFKLSSGLRSSVYVDLRRGLSNPRLYRMLASSLAEAVKELAVGETVVAGMATAGIPWAAMIAYLLGLPMAYVRVERKAHGTSRTVEGEVKGKRVLLVDDVATTGSTLAQGVEALRAEGAEVVAAVVIVDRCQGASARLRGMGVRLYALLTLPQLLSCVGRGDLLEQVKREGAGGVCAEPLYPGRSATP